MKPEIVECLGNVNLGMGHIGLEQLLKTKMKRTLQPGQIAVFINRANDKLKILGSEGLVLGYIRLKHGKLNLEAIQYLPTTFGAAGFNYSAALKKALERRFAQRHHTGGPLEMYRRMESSGLTARTAN